MSIPALQHWESGVYRIISNIFTLKFHHFPTVPLTGRLFTTLRQSTGFEDRTGMTVTVRRDCTCVRRSTAERLLLYYEDTVTVTHEFEAFWDWTQLFW